MRADVARISWGPIIAFFTLSDGEVEQTLERNKHPEWSKAMC